VPPAAAGADAGGLPAGKPAAEQYDYAFGLLRNSDYDGATRAFQAFLQQHAQDPLAGNAAFWLGQIEFAQGHYEQSAPIFLDAYRKYPNSAKAAESLLKVGLSMGNLGKKSEACTALRRFQTEFPDAADNLKRQATAERTKQGC
jgi:tol-pal system protein YbgF